LEQEAYPTYQCTTSDRKLPWDEFLQITTPYSTQVFLSGEVHGKASTYTRIHKLKPTKPTSIRYNRKIEADMAQKTQQNSLIFTDGSWADISTVSDRGTQI
jgi:hypothetical protein